MIVAHSVVITPGQCGLYETTWELVKGLRQMGVDSYLIDPTGSDLEHDRGIPIRKTYDADIIVNHSGLGEHEKTIDKPIIHVCHGRPMYSFLGENSGGTPVYSYQYNKAKDPRFKAVVTFWEEHKPYHEVMWHPTPVEYVPAPVDVEFWTPGATNHDWGGKGGDQNFVITDTWREDSIPFDALNAFILYNRKNPGSRLHIYNHGPNLKGWGAIIQKLKDQHGMGELKPRVGKDQLRAIYRKADGLLTNNKILTRTKREANACGCPVYTIKNINDEFVKDDIVKHGLYRSAFEFKRVLDGIIR